MKEKKHKTQTHIMEKSKITKAFKELRKKGYFAKQNFWCCQNCAWHALTDEQAKKAVFYHSQDAEDLRDTGNCHLAWSGDGQEIVDILTKNDVKVEWNGSENTRIKITV